MYIVATPHSGGKVSYIEGMSRTQATLLPEVLDDYIGEENEARVIDAFVESLNLVELGFLRAEPGWMGRPSYDPRDLLKLYIYGYLNRVRSSRALERECGRNLEVLWLMRRLQPDHRTIADFRRDHVKQLRVVCAEFVVVCREMELVGAELAAIDGTKLRAVNAKDRNYTRKELEELRAKAEAKLSAYLSQLAETDAAEEVEAAEVEALREKIERLKKRTGKHKAILARMDAEETDQVSLTDPESRRMKVGAGTAVCYNAQISVDAKHHLIVMNDVTNEENDLNQLSPMAVATKDALEVETLEVTVDAGYHNEDELAECEESAITAFAPRPKAATRNTKEGFAKSDFMYQPEQDAYLCPGGHMLEHRHEGQKQGKKLRYYRTSACKTCPLREQCTKDPRGRRIGRTPKEDVVERAEERLKERPGIMRERRCLAEHPFGTIKHWNGQGFFLMKGLEKVCGEFSLSVLGYNLRRAINLVGVVRLVAAMKAR